MFTVIVNKGIGRSGITSQPSVSQLLPCECALTHLSHSLGVRCSQLLLWSFAVPELPGQTADNITCHDMPTTALPSNGSWSCNNTTCTAQCNSGYQNVGGDWTVSCSAGQWGTPQGEAPFCTEATGEWRNHTNATAATTRVVLALLAAVALLAAHRCRLNCQPLAASLQSLLLCDSK